MIALNDDRTPTNINGRITALMNGKKTRYEFCCGGSIEEAKEMSKDLGFETYIGSSKIYYIDDVRNESREMEHYFNR